MNSWLKFYLALREDSKMQQQKSKKTNSSRTEAKISASINKWICAISELCTMFIKIPNLIMYKSTRKNLEREDFGCDC